MWHPPGLEPCSTSDISAQSVGTRHLIALFEVIFMLSVDVWKDDHCVSACCCRSWGCTRILGYYALRFHGLVLIEHVVVLTEIGNFLVFGGSWIQCKSRPVVSVMLQTRARTQDLRFLQQYWWWVKSSWDVTPCRLVNSYRRLGGWCWFHLQGPSRVRVGQQHVALSIRINAVLYPKRF